MNALALNSTRVLTASFDCFNTPAEVLAVVRELGPIGLDPCSNPFSVVAAATEWSLENGDDGLASSWEGHGLVFLNPGYSHGSQGKWVTKACEEASRGVEVVALLQARTDTRWFASIWRSAAAVCFWEGRIQFLGGESKPMFASALPYWGPHPHLFAHAFSTHGKVVVL